MDSLLAHRHIGQAELAVLSTTQHSFEECCPLAPAEQDELYRITNPQRRKERWACLYLLHQVLGINAPLRHAPNGAPMLQGLHTHISLSHTTDAACIILHPHYSVGIDIERKERRFALVASRILSETEMAFVQNNPELQGLAWCAKEAVYKMAGVPSLNLAHDIQLAPFAALPNTRIEATLMLPAMRTQLSLGILALPHHHLVYGWI